VGQRDQLSAGGEARGGWVYLVGAGPGDPGLITVRGAELLATADVVLHDELIDHALLDRAHGQVQSVGKRGSDEASKQAAQDSINAALVAHAHDGKSVVRLKGGDPFLFGRGAEEVLALRAAQVPFEVVSGVSSAVGATGYAGIPLTHRDIASSVTFVTAVKRGGESFDWSELQRVQGTVCVFMGLRRLEQICRALMIDAGRPPQTPAAVVQWISRPQQRCVEGTLADIAHRTADQGLGSPSLLIVGEVAAMRDQLSWFDAQPLFGKRVLVTRPAHQAASTLTALRRRGAQPVPFPSIAIEPPPDPTAVTRAVATMTDYDLVVFTSANGVQWFWREVERQGRDARAFGGIKLAAIGPATAAGLRNHGLEADIVAETFVAEQLAESILAHVDSPARVMLPRALVAREVLPNMLRASGMQVDVVPVYQTTTATPRRAQLLRDELSDIDVVLLTSSSTVQKLCELLGEDAAEQLATVMLASIGPITTKTAEDLGLAVAVTAEVSTATGLVDALERALSSP